MGRFAERIALHGLARVHRSARKITHLLQEGDQAEHRLKMRGGQLLPFPEIPGFIVAGQQIPPIPVHGLRKQRRLCEAVIGPFGSLQTRFEFGHVGEDRFGVHLHGGAVGKKDGAGGHARGLQLMAQRGERCAEAVPARIGAACRPEQLDEFFARMGFLAVIGQVGKQKAGL